MIEEKKSRVTITHGMANVHKHSARKCPSCDLGIGKYPGRYPEKCPSCEVSLKPTVEAQTALVRYGVPARDVALMVREGMDLSQFVFRHESGELAEDIASDIRRAAGAVRAAKGATKSRLGAAKKSAQELRKERERQKKRKEKRKSTKPKEKPRKPKRGRSKPKRTPSGKPKQRKQPTKKESIMRNSSNWSNTPLGKQEDAIRKTIGLMISENGHASLLEVQHKFKVNPVALSNLVRERQEKWNVILTERGGKVYPRKQGDPIHG